MSLSLLTITAFGAEPLGLPNDLAPEFRSKEARLAVLEICQIQEGVTLLTMYAHDEDKQGRQALIVYAIRNSTGTKAIVVGTATTNTKEVVVSWKNYYRNGDKWRSEEIAELANRLKNGTATDAEKGRGSLLLKESVRTSTTYDPEVVAECF